MVVPSYELGRLDGYSFEHLVNALALRVLGAGLTSFAPGSDGGRDGFFEGAAPYPSDVENWSGRWYIQSKFHPPHLSKDPQKWLLQQIKEELKSFSDVNSKRKIPDNWIVATNIDPSGVPETGSFDAARRLVKAFSEDLGQRFHIWGGRKILDLLAKDPVVAEHYGEFLTPGTVLKKLYDNLGDASASMHEVMRYLIATQLTEQQYTKLEQAGSSVDDRPGIQRLFTDIPFIVKPALSRHMAAETLAKALAEVHRLSPFKLNEGEWHHWNKTPSRARAWFIRGGPGQGKSTLGQYMAQIHRAAFILSAPWLNPSPTQVNIALEIKSAAARQSLWPESPRIPVSIELREYAHWYGGRKRNESTRVLVFLAERLSKEIGISVQGGTLKRAFSQYRWLHVFDGLDEVPGDVKDQVAAEVTHFVDDLMHACNADAMILCTSRPQGYSGQFSHMDAAHVDLVSLSPAQALACAKPLLETGRSAADSRVFIEILTQALKSPAIAEIMTTPLQSHIMAVIVRDGGRPPERRWQLFNTFYEVIKKREANRHLPDKALAKLLRDGDQLLRALHNKLGFILHERAETAKGATTSLSRDELKVIVTDVVRKFQDKQITATVNTLMKAATDRLVLVNTPDNGDFVRFDIRPLQEFFAAEHVYKNDNAVDLDKRIRVIAADSHWREVMHFLLSAFIENRRASDLAIVTTILTEVDSDDLSCTRTFNRRLGCGARVAGRLVAEGVLEQDKQVRQRLHGVIIPLAAQIDGSFWPNRKRQPHTTAWMQEVFISALREQALPETMGAAVALTFLLTRKDRRSQLLSEFLESAPFDYRAHFLAAIRRHGMAMSRVPEWMGRLAFNLLCSRDWLQHPSCLYGAFDVICAPVCSTIFGDDDIARMLVKIFADCVDISPEFDRQDTIFGGIKANIKVCPSTLDYTRWPNELWRRFSATDGYLKAIYSTFYLLQARDEFAVNQLSEALGGAFSNADWLPARVRNLLAGNLLKFDYERGEVPAEMLIAPRSTSTLYYVGDLELSDQGSVRWDEVAEDNPYLFAQMISCGGNARLDEFIGREEEKALNALYHSNVLWDERGLWGALFSHKQIGKKLRSYVVKNARGNIWLDRYVQNLCPFALSLPEEASILPDVLGTMLDGVEHRYNYEENASDRKQLADWAAGYITAPRALKNVWTNIGFPDRAKFAALIFDMLHPKGSARVNYKLLCDLFDCSEAPWQLPSIGYALLPRLVEREREAVTCFGTLLERSAHNFLARTQTERLLYELREKPGSPVANSNQPHLWG